MPEVDQESCSGCETCVEKCPVGAMQMIDDVAEVNQGRCIGCGVCAGACPVEAITLTKRPENTTVTYPEDLVALAKVAREERKMAS